MGERVVVDTNIPIVANGIDTHADGKCRLSCTKKIIDIKEKKLVVALDDDYRILREYLNKLPSRAGDGVGDEFIKYIHNHIRSPSYVMHVKITPADDDRGFAELPPNALDRSDRKFLAVAKVADATIINATDSDWHEQREFIEDLGVEVEQLCPQHAC